MNIQEEKNTFVKFCSQFTDMSCAENVVRNGIALFFLMVVAYCTWTLDRGFEITDESYYLLLAMHADSVKLFISGQQWITKGIWQVTGNLAMFRAAGMIALIGSSSLLALGAISAFSHCGSSAPADLGRRTVVIAGSGICALLYAASINLSPCYNLLASSGAYAAAGLALLASRSGVKWQQLGMFLLAGTALGMEFICKASAGLATLCLVAILVSVFGQSFRDKLIGVSAILLGFALFVFVLVSVQTTMPDAENSIRQGFELFRMVQVEPIGSRLARYLTDFLEYSVDAVFSFGILIFAVAVYLIRREMIYVGIIFASLAYILISGEYLLGGVDRYTSQMTSALMLCALVLLVSTPIWKRNVQTVALIGVLAALPYSVAIGTGNSLFTQIIVSLAPWGTLLGLIATSRFAIRTDKIVTMILFGGFITAVSAQIVISGFRAPYNMKHPLSEQFHAVPVGDLGSVRVDSETSKFISDLKNAAKTCGIVRGTPFFGLYNVPGVSLVLETVPVLTPWINNPAQAKAVLERAPSNILNSAVVAVQLTFDGSMPRFPETLASFPTGFQYCGDATYPFGDQRIQIWHSRNPPASEQ